MPPRDLAILIIGGAILTTIGVAIITTFAVWVSLNL
jgi:hypothetical protein